MPAKYNPELLHVMRNLPFLLDHDLLRIMASDGCALIVETTYLGVLACRVSLRSAFDSCGSGV